MKREWENAELGELSFQNTNHRWTGIYRDGGYIGDGVISGHLSWDKPENPPKDDPSKNS